MFAGLGSVKVDGLVGVAIEGVGDNVFKGVAKVTRRMIEVALFFFLGVGAGVAAGLLPGLHPNTLFVMMVSALPALAGVSLVSLLVFVVALSVTNVMVSFVPALFMGAPEADTALSILPGHQYVLQGRGLEALYLTVIGGVGATLGAALTFPFLMSAVPVVSGMLEPIMHYALAAIILWMCWTDRSPGRAALVFLMAGGVGVVLLDRLPSEVVLFPALTGLFGFSQLLVSLQEKGSIPPQLGTVPPVKGYAKGIVGGYVAGFFAAVFPGIGTAQASVLSAGTFRSSTKDFLVSLGGINAANIFFTFVLLFAIGKTRSGAVWAIAQLTSTITTEQMVIVVVAGVAACLLAGWLTMVIGKQAVKLFSRVDYTALTQGVIVFLAILVVAFGGLVGVLIAISTTCLGVIGIRLQVRRTHLMGVLVMPAILYFAGRG